MEKEAIGDNATHKQSEITGYFGLRIIFLIGNSQKRFKKKFSGSCSECFLCLSEFKNRFCYLLFTRKGHEVCSKKATNFSINYALT